MKDYLTRFVLLPLLCSVTVSAQTFDLTYRSAVIRGTITNSFINEASGLAASSTEPGAFWTHNDSGDGPNLYLVGPNGKSLTRGSVFGATSRDWEDLASFEKDGEPYLIIGDFGDNSRARNPYYLYIIREPVYDSSRTAGNSYPIYKRITYTYANGRQDCESIGIDVENGQIILISKSRNGGNFTVYELPLNLDGEDETLVATPIAAFNVDGATTAMDIAEDGQHAVVLTYGDAFQFTRYVGQTWGQAFTGEPRRISMPERPGGEAIAYGTGGSDLYSVREGNSSPLWYLQAMQEAGTVFRVDLFEVDRENFDRVFVNITGQEEAIELTDTDGDGIYAGRIELPLGETYGYYFSYSKETDPPVAERVGGNCAAADSLREVNVDRASLQLRPVLFGQCAERPYYLTVQTDLDGVADLIDGGKVWVEIVGTGEVFELVDRGNDIYAYRIPLPRGRMLRYRFAYQNGPDAATDRVFETVPAPCDAGEDTRSYTADREVIVLLADEFGTCEQALPEGSDITNLDGTRIRGSNDGFPWLGPEIGLGSPPGQEVDKLIDGEVGTKYLVRDNSSWVEINLPNYSVVNAYTITSGGDAPSRDPRSWTWQGYNADNQKWDTLHQVMDNPSWPERDQRQSWYFDNDSSYATYRLDITAINGNAQRLMQMAELDIFGTVGLPVLTTTTDVAAATLSAYPNPTAGVLHFRGLDETSFRYTVVTAAGVRVTGGRMSPGETLDMAALPAGMYFMHIDTGRYRRILRVVKR